MKKPQIVLKDGRVNFAGNDYLGMAKEKRLADAMYKTALEYGISPTSSRWGAGWTQVFQDLEDHISAYFATDDSTILGAAYLGGLVYFGSIKSLVDIVLIDETSHVNLYKGIAAAGLAFERYKHLCTKHLEELLDKHKSKRICIATDGLWGISGEIPPIKKIVELSKVYGTEVFVDDAHGVFGMGQTGKGTVEYCGVSSKDVTLLGSLSKALGVSGGFLAGRAELVDLFRRNDTTSGTSTSAIPIAGAADEAIKMLIEDPSRRVKLHEVSRKMREILLKYGIQTAEQESPIVALVLKDEWEAQKVSDALLANGLVAPYFKYASEPRHNFLRCVAKSSYTDEVLATFEKTLQSIK